jgi:hypothetical protein
VSIRARFGGCSKSVFAAVRAVPEIAIGQDRSEAIQVLQQLSIVNEQASSPWQEPRGVQRWETAEAEHGEALLCPGTLAGAHSGVRLAVVPLSGEFGAAIRALTRNIREAFENRPVANQSERRR